jgi:hypothetical protein
MGGGTDRRGVCLGTSSCRSGRFRSGEVKTTTEKDDVRSSERSDGQYYYCCCYGSGSGNE